jgi:hypothetical protein
MENQVKSKPWIAIDLFTGQVLGNYHTDAEAYSVNAGQPVSVQYAPNAREVK